MAVQLATNRELAKIKPMALALYIGQRIEGPASQRERAIAGLILRAVRAGDIEPEWIGYRQEQPVEQIIHQLPVIQQFLNWFTGRL